MSARALCLAALLAAATPALGQGARPAPAADFPHKDTPEASIYRGEIVFSNYCVLCHGATAEGNGRSAKLYNPKPANLRTSMMNDAYKRLIIQRGGKALGRSEFMPPWGEELTVEQITDVVNFLRSIAPKDAPQ